MNPRTPRWSLGFRHCLGPSLDPCWDMSTQMYLVQYGPIPDRKGRHHCLLWTPEKKLGLHCFSGSYSASKTDPSNLALWFLGANMRGIHANSGWDALGCPDWRSSTPKPSKHQGRWFHVFWLTPTWTFDSPVSPPTPTLLWWQKMFLLTSSPIRVILELQKFLPCSHIRI